MRPNPSAWTRIGQLATVATSGFAVLTGYSVYKGHEHWYENLVMPLFRLLDAEDSHKFAIIAAKYGLIPRLEQTDPPELAISIFGFKLQNPIGLAAGFDKDGEAIRSLLSLGFGFVEIGSVTPEPQLGNPKPRVFRLSDEQAIINRYGFNSHGHRRVAERLAALKTGEIQGVIGVNLGKNKESPDPVDDYLKGIRLFASLADYLVINVSSPNTPGLRDLQKGGQLRILLKAVRRQLKELGEKRKPLLLKLSPDLSEEERREIAEVILQEETRVDGLIISNTTSADHPARTEAGGLSGRPLTRLSTGLIADMYRLTKGAIPIIGVGGVFTGKDALEKIKSGASLIQIYTSFAYHGPPRVNRIKRELLQLLNEEGLKSVEQAIGSAHHQ